MKSRSLAPWLLLSPFLLTFCIFFAYPIVRSLFLATEQTFGAGTTRFVGLENIQRLLIDPLFYTALWNTFLFTLGSVFIQLPIALGLALLLEVKGLRGKSIFRVILFSPAMVGVAFSAMIFGVVFEKRTGVLNRILHGLFGFDLDYAWLQDHLMSALIVAALWMYVGFNMVFFSAALQNVRRELHEAATIDGAGPFSRFIHVIVPAIRPVAGFVVLLSITGSFQLFELPWLMLNSTPGPDNRGLTVVMYLYQAGFDSNDLGYASAIGWALTLILIIIALGQRWLNRRHAEEA
ncbi:MAG TPA: sugar ABC transporter permease [Phycisphaerales bacterium]|nr:sugar ABC transporter permease [Phycisphaerales bacterium]